MTKVTRVISVDLVPADAIGALKLRAAIDEMRAADPTLEVAIGPVNEIVLQGMSELHLEITVDLLKRNKGLDFTAGGPQVRYIECITKTIVGDYTHKRQSGGRGEYAKVKIRFEPGEPGSGFLFRNEVAGGAVPAAFIPAVERGLSMATETGTIVGLPVTDLVCTLIDGGYHDVNSSIMTFEIAAIACFREALPKAGPRVLEPVMKVEVATPEEFMGDVIGDLNSRRGQVQGMDNSSDVQVISALVPLSNLFGYVRTLKSMTRGRATHTMTFSHYEQVPPHRPNGDDDFPMAAALRW